MRILPVSEGPAESPSCQYYNRNCEEYHRRTFSLDPSSFLDPLARMLPRGAHVLDVGCSSGRDLCWMKERGFIVTGFEASPGLASLARENARCTVIEGDFRSYDFSRLSAEALILSASLVHLPQNEMPAVLDNIMKALRPGGTVLLSLKEGRGIRTDSSGRIFHLWTDIDLRTLFSSRNLDVRHFSRRESLLATSEVWLEYVLVRREDSQHSRPE